MKGLFIKTVQMRQEELRVSLQAGGRYVQMLSNVFMRCTIQGKQQFATILIGRWSFYTGGHYIGQVCL